MKSSKVVLIRCDTYDRERVNEAVREGMSLLGGVGQFVQAGEKIVLKPNVLIGSNPEKCVCTHPFVFRAAGTVLKEAGVELSYGDSSGFGGCQTNMKRGGFKQVADELGIRMADFNKGKSVAHDKALLNTSFVLANGVIEADGLVSVSKLKSHGLTRLTGAIKNQFGCIPGIRKGQFHIKMADPYEFATMLVDLNTLIRPRLYMMDGIMAMEGNGPRSGKPKKLGVLLFSSDPVALDAIACKIIDLDPTYVPTSEPGERAGLGTFHYQNIELVGDKLESFIDKSFEVVRKPPASVTGGPMRTLLKNQLCPKPVIDATKCTRCGICVKQCPLEPKAVNWYTGDESTPPTYQYDLCIRCYCCQELCPEGAISLKETLLGRAIFR
jgi:uncharacterized protein (DUF362 family)/NAD-dependent dihydropyrimidine dehydrogenase PreA subunit